MVLSRARTITLLADGPGGLSGSVSFDVTGSNTVTITAPSLTTMGTLHDAVGIATISFDWSLICGNGTNSLGSTAHTIYVTYGTPQPATDLTVKRIDWVCTSAAGKSGLQECADAVFDSLSGSFDLGASKWGPSPIWLLHNPGERSQCPGLAKYVDAHFQILGLGAGAIRFCRAKPDGTYEANASAEGPETEWRTIVPGTGHPSPTTHDDEYPSERLAHIDGDGNANAYEATCLFDGHYYALGVSRDETTAKGVVWDAFTSVQWQYRTGASDPYTFHECTEDPWVEAP